MERPKMEKPKSEYQQKILDVRRVARVMAGGRELLDGRASIFLKYLDLQP